MFIETRFFDNGSAQAMMHKRESCPEIEASEGYDAYIDAYDSIEDYVFGELDVIIPTDIAEIVIALGCGEWVDITPYC